ncbi:MAG TPA: glycosyltransferase family A protein [Thermoplasmata archaeon]|nr:glycosyltransferase family A protein [Thermoplasmata archaeon]
MSASSDYIIITAVKNESAMLDGLYKSVVAQTSSPLLWLIAEDGSTDDTCAMAQSMAAKHPWIAVASREEVQNPFWVKPNSAAAFGISEAAKECESRGIDYSAVAVLDADTSVEPDYFDRLVRLMNDRPGAVIASGMIATEGGQGLEARPSPRGCARLYDRRFLEEVGGFPIAASSDTVLEIKAKNRGYAFVVDPEARGLHRRKSTNITDARGLRSLAVIRYTMGMDMLSFVAWSVAYSRALGLRSGVAFMGGYLEAVRGKYTRTDDAEVIRYFRGSWKRLLNVPDTRRAMRDMLAVQL